MLKIFLKLFGEFHQCFELWINCWENQVLQHANLVTVDYKIPETYPQLSGMMTSPMSICYKMSFGE